MATQQFVSKTHLIGAIREVAGARDTGILTILTDTRRSVLLRFSQGRLIQVHCRTRDVSDAIGVLNECEQLKYTFVPAQAENRVEVMPVDTFLRMLAPGAGDDAPAAPRRTPEPHATRAAAPTTFDDQGELLPQFARLLDEDDEAPGDGDGPAADLKDALTRMAMDYVGPMASFLVDDAMNPWVSVSDSIERIASMIPDEVQSSGFREAATERFLK